MPRLTLGRESCTPCPRASLARQFVPRRQAFLPPIKADAKLEARKRSQLDRLYQRVIDDLDALVRAVGLKAA
jgi:hypothetical protein